MLKHFLLIIMVTLSDNAQAHNGLLAEVKRFSLAEMLDAFHEENSKYPMLKWISIYMKEVQTLLIFIRGTRERNWELHLGALERLCPYFFAYDRLDYAQNVPEYLAHMQDIEAKSPQIWKDYKSGMFTVKTGNTPFIAIGVDQAQENANKVHKGEGGVSGITNNPESFLKYCSCFIKAFC